MKLLEHNISLRILCLAAALLTVACSTFDEDFIIDDTPYSGGATSSRVTNDETRDVFIIWSLGFNNLSRYLKEDLDDIAANWLPGSGRTDDVVLAFCHNTAGSYSVKTSPVLVRLYRDVTGVAQRDTILTLPKETISASSDTMKEILTYIKKEYPAAGYGMLVSSHGTGWVPEGYCSNPSYFEGKTMQKRMAGQKQEPVPYRDMSLEDGMPLTKSIGCQNISSKQAYEMDIAEMADAMPMKMDYIIFDACFMGGIEVAYELKDVSRKLIFSQTEILADGMDYTTMLSYLLENDEPDFVGFCTNYFNHYDNLKNEYRSATISMIDCTRLEPLAQTCRAFFESHRTEISALHDNNDIQKYFRSSQSGHRWFFDLKSIVECSGASEAEMNSLQDALGQCILFKAATPEFMLSFKINTHCGLSMYLPYKDKTYLNNFYKSLEWNKTTSLIN